MKLLTQVLILSLLAMVSLMALASSSSPDDVSVQRYVLPQRGHFELKVPITWHARVTRTTKPVPPQIEFAARKGAPFIMTVTPIWQTATTQLPTNKEELRKRVEYAVGGIQPFAVETKINLIELEGASGPGFYFSATDQAPLPGGYKFMNKGALLVNDLTVMFTLLTNEGQEAIVRQALGMLQSARHVPPARSPSASPRNKTTPKS